METTEAVLAPDTRLAGATQELPPNESTPRRAIHRMTTRIVVLVGAKVDVKPTAPTAPAGQLSNGAQQRFARPGPRFHRNPTLQCPGGPG